MKNLGKKDVIEAVLIAALTALAGRIIDYVFDRLDEKAKKKERERRKSEKDAKTKTDVP